MSYYILLRRQAFESGEYEVQQFECNECFITSRNVALSQFKANYYSERTVNANPHEQ